MNSNQGGGLALSISPPHTARVAMPTQLMTKIAIKRAVLYAWKMLLLMVRCRRAETHVEGLNAEVEAMAGKLGKQSTSVWNMKKNELVATVVREIGMGLNTAQARTVPALRDLVLQHRAFHGSSEQYSQGDDGDEEDAEVEQDELDEGGGEDDGDEEDEGHAEDEQDE